MAPATRLCLALPLRPTPVVAPSSKVAAAIFSSSASCRRAAIHTPLTQPLRAKVEPSHGNGPPPPAPVPAAEFADGAAAADEGYAGYSRVARRKRQAEMLRQARDIRNAASAHAKDKSAAAAEAAANIGGVGRGTATAAAQLKRRFWKDVVVREVDGFYQVFLDSRPLRRPNATKDILTIPLTKPHLANALALEWDQLLSAQEAAKQHLIPLMSLTCRALDIADDDAAHSLKNTVDPAPIRASIVTSLLRYLDTDSLLCWAPPADPSDRLSASNATNKEGKSLRDLQKETALSIVSYLTARVWPGISIVPVLEGESLLPRQQEPGTREVVQGWVLGLSSWELAGLERATLAGKSLLGGARLVVEWSEGDAGVGYGGQFGVEEAARAASVETEWQTRKWGEVEDTHDVEKEDVRRQFGSVVLLVSGRGMGNAQ
ncbi:hypothetical protein B0T17DRAFT_490393 [Bombardia bombarda]|uniref:Uncharacterized protein n=1 Tax=Bombardia bombarda TaxID=252184 RepID=A0AA39X782_9PEZI|nr:hypothetical protein B0T17DRAFT_490393 [Bombardia bombarda]